MCNEFDKCPWCGSEDIHQIEKNTICGTYWYYECFDCGWCSDEEYEPGFYFGDPDIEWDDMFDELFDE